MGRDPNPWEDGGFLDCWLVWSRGGVCLWWHAVPYRHERHGRSGGRGGPGEAMDLWLREAHGTLQVARRRIDHSRLARPGSGNGVVDVDRKSTRLNSNHRYIS